MGKQTADIRAVNWLQGFIDKYYSQQHGVVRGIVFLFFAGLLGLLLYRTVAGSHVVPGYVLEKAPGGGRQPVRNKEVRLNGVEYGTNFSGKSFFVFSPGEYYLLLAKGEIEVELVDITAQRTSVPMKATFNRLDNQLTDFVVKEPAKEAGEPSAGPARNSGLALVSPAIAGEPPAYRLFVNSIELGSNFGSATQGTLELFIDGSAYPLRDARTQKPVSEVPLLRGDKVILGDAVYFDLPRNPDAPSRLMVETPGFFGKNKQSFEVQLGKLKPGEQAALAAGGHKIVVSLMHVYDVSLYSKDDLDSKALRNALVARGYRTVVKPSPLGHSQPTNAIFLGTKVPHKAAQEFVTIVTAQKVALKTVACNVALKSGNQREMQLGAWRAYDNAPLLSPDKIRTLTSTSSSDEFCSIARNPALERRGL